MKTSAYSNGKLLITGEYLVLDGALALAVPTIPGQEMIVEPGKDSGVLRWQSYYENKPWFRASFSYPGMQVIETNDTEGAAYLRVLITETLKLSASPIKEYSSLQVTTRLGFHPDWGLGSSSSLISNLATIFGIDPFELFFNTQKGSGYDIACAKAKTALFYRLEQGKPHYESVDLRLPFADRLALVYSGRKQSSAESVGSYIRSGQQHEYEKGSISAISREIVKARNIAEFNALLDEHEKIISGVLNMPTIKDARFADFPGSIKSLGAWGGDFMLASSEFDFNEIKDYFSGKGLDIVFRFDELVLK